MACSDFQHRLVRDDHHDPVHGLQQEVFEGIVDAGRR
jgi:hypothetical protein